MFVTYLFGHSSASKYASVRPVLKFDKIFLLIFIFQFCVFYSNLRQSGFYLSTIIPFYYFYFIKEMLFLVYKKVNKNGKNSANICCNLFCTFTKSYNEFVNSQVNFTDNKKLGIKALHYKERPLVK